jgi:predicted adenine nucleotide alpha hydrolase (AANH) superfamily ATPase
VQGMGLSECVRTFIISEESKGDKGGVSSMNYQKELDKLVQKLSDDGRVPKLLLHSCCAPCSSYVLEYLSNYFEITVLYYNPNIFPESEYTKRIWEQQKLIDEMNVKYPISFMAGPYDKEKFYEMAKGLEEVKEGGVRCFGCYELRLRETARIAAQAGFDYFTTTLSISPLKNAEKLNEIGVKLAEEYGVSYLLSDFKKKNGYKRSIELSKQYGLYRQDYCGCEFSKKTAK